MYKRLTSLPRGIKTMIVVASDIILVTVSLWAALALRLGELAPDVSRWPWIFVLAPLVCVLTFSRLGIYRTMVRYIAPGALYLVAKATAITSISLAAVVAISLTEGVPRSLYFIFWLLATVLLAGSRYAVRFYYGRFNNELAGATPVLIYGAGDSGFHLATAMLGGKEYWPVAFVDDNAALHGRVLHSLPVHDPSRIQDLIEEFEVSEIMLAIPSASPEERRSILNTLLKLPVQVRTIPSMKDLVAGRARGDELREVSIGDLLGRVQVEPDEQLLSAAISCHSVMITGGGGSIGSELCRQILALRPATLVIYEVSEYALYRISQELEGAIAEAKTDTVLVPVLGSVQDEQLLSSTIQHHRVSVMFHAAAYKHVPIVESNVGQGILNNVFGTLAAARAAAQNDVERFVLVSTDKAVRPTNVMGATKRVAELITQNQAGISESTIFCMVRFGNVLGSSGSVVPLFGRQIASGGPVTVTHPEITRYFMTIPEAAQLVIQAGAMASGGEVFVLDMGKPVRIVDLAHNMIRLAGKSIREADQSQGDIEIRYTGLRPGEKLYEELLIGDNVSGTAHPMIMCAEEDCLSPETLQQALEQLRTIAVSQDDEAAISILQTLVSGYTPARQHREQAAGDEQGPRGLPIH